MSDQPTGADAAPGDDAKGSAGQSDQHATGSGAGSSGAPQAHYQDEVTVETLTMNELPSQFATNQLSAEKLAEAASAQAGAAGGPATPQAGAEPKGATPAKNGAPEVYAAPYVAAAYDAAVAAYEAGRSTGVLGSEALDSSALPESDVPPEHAVASAEPPAREVYQGEQERYVTGFLTYLAPDTRIGGVMGVTPERQVYLAQRYAITPNVEQGSYRYKDIEPKLTRGDIEWLLAGHESRGIRGPVNWSEEEHRRRIGLDLRGADLSGLDLSGLPLARVRLGLSAGEWLNATAAAREMAAAHLEGANLQGTHLEGANLRGAHLRGADLTEALLLQAIVIGAHLEGANLTAAHLEEADLGEVIALDVDCSQAHLEGADLHGARLERSVLRGAHFERANLDGAHLEQAQLEGAHAAGATFNGAFLESAVLNGAGLDGANFYAAHLAWAQATGAHLDGAFLNGAHLESATLNGAHLARADLRETHLEGASLRAAHLESADLRRATFDDKTSLADAVLGTKKLGYASLGDIRWGGIDLTTVDWRQVKRLGDERAARGRDASEGGRAALRAYRQVAAQLRALGMVEEADRFTYRAFAFQRGTLLRSGRLLQYLFSWFLALLTGYGYHPGRALFWYLAIVGGFALAYLQLTTGGFTGSSPAALWSAVMFSFGSFHGGGFFQTGQNLGNLAAILPKVEAVIGLIIEATFVITTVRRYLTK